MLVLYYSRKHRKIICHLVNWMLTGSFKKTPYVQRHMYVIQSLSFLPFSLFPVDFYYFLFYFRKKTPKFLIKYIWINVFTHTPLDPLSKRSSHFLWTLVICNLFCLNGVPKFFLILEISEKELFRNLML